MTSSDLRASLDELEKSLRSFGAPVTAAFRPGARPEQVRALLAAECLTPSDDLLTWWSWHDGAEVGAPPVESGPGIHYRAENTLFGPWHILSVAEALRIRRWQLEMHRGLTIEQAFPASWLPVLTTDGAGDLCADTGAPGPTPLRIRDEGFFGVEPPKFSSLSELVECILEVFDAGLVVPARWDPRVPSADLATLAAGQRRLVVW